MAKEKLSLVLVLILAGISVFFAWKYSVAWQELGDARVQLSQRAPERKAIEFTRTFVVRVLKAEHEVSFDDRLRLENMVRDLKDNAVLDEWNRFVSSKTESEAQEQAKNLLSLLVSKM